MHSFNDWLTSWAHTPALWIMAGFAAFFGLTLLILQSVKPTPRRKVIDANWLGKNYPWVLIAVGGSLGVGALVLYLYEIGAVVNVGVDRLEDAVSSAPVNPEQASADFRNYGTGIAALLAALAAAATLIFQLIRVWINERTASTAEQGMITDRINKAVLGLGEEKVIKVEALDDDGKQRLKKDGTPIMIERTVPNTEVRIGALYALERIAQDSLRDHIQIMKIICAYIRNNAGTVGQVPPEPEPLPDDFGTGDIDRYEMQTLAETKRAEWSIWRAQVKQPDDIRVALEILSDRSARQRAIEQSNTSAPPDIHTFEKHAGQALATALSKDPTKLGAAVDDALTPWKRSLLQSRHFQLDLRNADLRGADLTNLTLELGRFEGTQLQGTEIQEAILQGADLRAADLRGGDLFKAKLQGAYLDKAELQGAYLRATELQGVGLWEAELQGVDLGHANLQGADLASAKLQGTDLGGAKLQGTYLGGAKLQGTDLRRAKLQGADLRAAELQGANLWDTNLQGSDLGGAKLEFIDLSQCHLDRTRVRHLDLSQLTRFPTEMLQYIFGVKKGEGQVTLPNSTTNYPDHWHDATDPKWKGIEPWIAYSRAYQKWLATNPPAPPDDIFDRTG